MRFVSSVAALSESALKSVGAVAKILKFMLLLENLLKHLLQRCRGVNNGTAEVLVAVALQTACETIVGASEPLAQAEKAWGGPVKELGLHPATFFRTL